MKDSFILYQEHKEIFEMLTDEEAGKLIKAIFEYEKTGRLLELDKSLKLAFIPIKNDLDRNKEKYEKIVKRNKENGKKGGRPKNPKNPVDYLGYLEKPKKADNDNEYDNEYDNDNDSSITTTTIIDAYENNIAPITEISSQMLLEYCSSCSPELVLLAIKESVKANKRSAKYIEGILRNWEHKGLKTVIDVKNEQEEFKRAKDTGQIETEEEKNQRKIKELEEAIKNGH